MSFVHPAFFLFLAGVALVSARLPSARIQNVWLLAASLLFYGWGEPAWLWVLVASVCVDAWAAQRLSQSGRRWPLWVSVGVNLGMLCTFKYLAFFADGLSAVAVALGGVPLRVRPEMPLPPGISFFTFQSMAYTFDVAAGRVVARRSWVDVGAHIAAFPQLVAGPIERAGDLLPQLEVVRRPTAADVHRGLSRLSWGAVQKLVVADTVGVWVDAVFATPDAAPALVWAGVLAFMVQILADFSGYTDIARGSGDWLGLRLSQNFDRPYAAASPAAFWRRWHQTFSRWMHDYVYRPLRGAHGGPLRTACAAIVSLVLAGIWHGASWNFVVWGGWFAFVWLVWRVGAWALPVRWISRLRPLGVGLTFAVVAVGMLLFREPSVARSIAVLRQVPWTGTDEDLALAASVAGVALVGALVLSAGGVWMRQEQRVSPTLRAVVLAVCWVLLWVFGADTDRDFVYFRF